MNPLTRQNTKQQCNQMQGRCKSVERQTWLNQVQFNLVALDLKFMICCDYESGSGMNGSPRTKKSRDWQLSQWMTRAMQEFTWNQIMCISTPQDAYLCICMYCMYLYVSILPQITIHTDMYSTYQYAQIHTIDMIHTIHTDTHIYIPILSYIQIHTDTHRYIQIHTRVE